MGNYSVIADVTAKFMEKLRKALVPEIIADENKIQLCSPPEHEDAELGIWLYNIKECEDIRVSGMLNVGMRVQKYPPMFLSLYMMLTPFSTSDVKFRAGQEQRILGKILQTFNDDSYIHAGDSSAETSGFDMRVEFLNLEPQSEKEIWTFNDTPYRTSLFYRITPVELESENIRSVGRVSEFEIHLDEGREKHAVHKQKSVGGSAVFG